MMDVIKNVEKNGLCKKWCVPSVNFTMTYVNCIILCSFESTECLDSCLSALNYCLFKLEKCIV